MYDGLGSVVGEVDVVGNVTATKLFDVYGATRGGSGTGTTKQGFVGGLGHETDGEAGLVYKRARYYDPGVGRFISEDPAFNGRNWFAYADEDPINMVDAIGKAPSAWDVAFSAGLCAFFAALICGVLSDAHSRRAIDLAYDSAQGGVFAVFGALAGYASVVGLMKTIIQITAVLKQAAKLAIYGIGGIMIAAVAGYAGIIVGEMINNELSDDSPLCDPSQYEGSWFPL